MAKHAKSKTQKPENLPALPVDLIIAKELENPEGVLQLDDFTIKMKPREKGFLVAYDADWVFVNELPTLIVNSSELYWAHFDGKEYLRRPLDDPPSKKEADKWSKHGKLTVHHPKYGQGAFLLAPSGVLAFKGYLQKWKRQGVDVFGKPARIGSRVTKTGKGFIINVPRFLPGWLDAETDFPEIATINPPTVDQPDITVEDDVPF